MYYEISRKSVQPFRTLGAFMVRISLFGEYFGALIRNLKVEYQYY